MLYSLLVSLTAVYPATALQTNHAAHDVLSTLDKSNVPAPAPGPSCEYCVDSNTGKLAGCSYNRQSRKCQMGGSGTYCTDKYFADQGSFAAVDQCDPWDTPPPPTPQPTCEDGSTGTCIVSEDPHIEAFDGRQVSLLDSTTSSHATSIIDEQAGDMWLVKSARISIQARYVADDQVPERNLFVRAIAVGGPFLRGNTIVVGSLEDQVTYNDQEILENDSSSFEISEGPEFFVNAMRGERSLLVQNLSQQNAGVNIALPLGVNLTVNRLHHHVNVAVKMQPQEGQDGLCGNFNGVSADDAIEMTKQRFETKVQPQDSLFKDTRVA